MIGNKLTSDERFDEKWMPEPTTGCYLWTGAANLKGYGVFGRGGRTEGTVQAHRFSWERVHGAIPAGLFVLHNCHTPACVNVEHLRLGTAQDNSDDMVEAGRHKLGGPALSNARKTFCKRGHEFTEENTYWYSNGSRECRICKRAHGRGRQ